MTDELRNELAEVPLRNQLAVAAWIVLERDATQSMVNTQRADAIADALLPIVERRIAQARAETAEQLERVRKVADELDKPDGSGDRIAAGLIRDALTTAEAGITWRCDDCGADRWVGWRAGPKQDGFPLRAQCVPCGHVQEVPNGGM